MYSACCSNKSSCTCKISLLHNLDITIGFRNINIIEPKHPIPVASGGTGSACYGSSGYRLAVFIYHNSPHTSNHHDVVINTSVSSSASRSIYFPLTACK